MKRFLSVLLAVMMVLSSTVSYAAPSLADFVDSVIEAPEFEDELFEETPVEDDSATLFEETVTIKHDVEGILDDFINPTIQGGTYTIDELETMLDPDGKMDSNGYFLAGVKDAGGVFHENEVTFTEYATYTAVWDMYNILAGYEFDDGDALPGIEYGGTLTNGADNEISDGALVSTITAYCSGYRVNDFDSDKISFSSEEVTDIVYRMKRAGNSSAAAYIQYWIVNGGIHGNNVGVHLTEEFKVYSYKDNLGENWLTSDLTGFRLQCVVEAGRVLYTDYIRVLGADKGNALIDMSLAPEGYQNNFKIFIEDTTKVADVLAAADAALAEAGYAGQVKAKAVYLDGEKLDSSNVLKEQGVVDHSELKILFASKKILKAYEFTSGTESFGSQPNRSTVSHAPAYGEDGALKIYNLTSAEGGISDDIFLALSFNCAVEDFSDIEVRVMYDGTDYKNSPIEFESVHLAGTKLADGSTFDFGTSGFTPSGTYYVTEDEWTTFTYHSAISNLSSYLAKMSAISGVRLPFSKSKTYDIPDGASVYIDYIRIYGNDLATTYTLDVDGEIVEVDGEGMSTVADLFTADAVTATGKVPHALRIKGTDTILSSADALSGLYEAETLEVIFTEKKPLVAYEFTNGVADLGSTPDSAIVSYKRGAVTLAYDGVNTEPRINIDFTKHFPNGMLVSAISAIEVKAKFSGTGFNNSTTSNGSGYLEGYKTLEGTTDKISAGSGGVWNLTYKITDNEWTISKTAINSETTGASLARLTFWRFNLNGLLTAVGHSADIDYIRILGKENYPYVAILDGAVDGQPVTVTVPYDENTTVATAIDMMNLDNEAGYVSNIAGETGTTTLASLLNNKTGVLEFSYVDKIPATLVVDEEETDIYFEETETVADLFEKFVEVPFGKAAHALRYAGKEEFLFLKDTLEGVDENTTFQVIFTEYDDFGYDFDTAIDTASKYDGTRYNVDKTEYDGRKVLSIASAESQTGHRLILNSMAVPAGKLQYFYVTVYATGGASKFTKFGTTFWDSTDASGSIDDTFYGGASSDGVAVNGTTVADGAWFTVRFDASKHTNSPSSHTSYNQDGSVNETKPHGNLDKAATLASTGLNYIRFDITSPATDAVWYIDDVRFESTETLNVAVLDGKVNGVDVSVSVPYTDSTTIEDLIKKSGLNTEAGYISAINGTTEGTVTELLGGETGVLTFDYVDKTPVTLVVGEDEHTAYIESTDKASVLLANRALTATGKVAGALRIENTTTILSSDDELDAVEKDARLEVLWSENDDFGFDFDTALANGKVTVGGGTAGSWATLEPVDADEGETGKYAKFVYKAAKEDTETTKYGLPGDNARLNISSINIPAGELEKVVVRLRFTNIPASGSYIQLETGSETAVSQFNPNSISYLCVWGGKTFNVSHKLPLNGSWYDLVINKNDKTNQNATTSFRLDFPAAPQGLTIEVDDVSFIGKDILPIALFDLTAFGGEDDFAILYNASTTIEEVLAKINEKLNDDLLEITSLGGRTTGKLTDLLGGDSGYISEIGSVGKMNVAINENFTEGDETGLYGHVTLPASGIYAISTTIGSLMEQASVNYNTYGGIYEFAGFAASADGALLSDNTTVSEAGGTLYAIWREMNILWSYEFDGTETISGLSPGQSKGSYSDPVVQDGAYTVQFTEANGERVSVSLPTSIPKSEIRDIHHRIKATDSTPKTQYYIYNGGVGDDVSHSKSVTLGEDYTFISYNELIGDNLSWWDDETYGSNLTSFRIQMENISGALRTGTLYYDYIRVIGKDPLNYVTVDVSALTNVDNDVKVYSFNKYATFDQVLAKLDADIELDENTAITGLIYNDTTYTGSTTLYSVVGQTDCEMTVDYAKAKTITLENTTAPDETTVTSTISGKYGASTTLGTLKELLALDSEDYFVEGFAKEENGITLSDDTKLSDISARDADGLTLYVTYDKKVVLVDYDFSKDEDYNKLVSIGFRNIARTGHSTAKTSPFSHETEDGNKYARVTLKAHPNAVSAANAAGTLALEADTGINAISVKAGAGEVESIVMKLRYTFPENVLSYSNNVTGKTVDKDLVVDDTTFTAGNISAPAYYYWPDAATAVSKSFSNNYTVGYLNNLWYEAVIKHADFDTKGLYQFRIDTANLPDGTTFDIQYIRVLGKPLPEVNVDVSGVTENMGTFGTLTEWDLENVDYTAKMTFADLVEAIEFTPAEASAYRITSFTGEDGTSYALSKNMAEALGGTGTVNLTPVVEKVYSKKYVIDFGSEADIITTDKNYLDVTEHGKTLADLAALVVDYGNKIFVGFAEEPGSTEPLSMTKDILPSNEAEWNEAGGTPEKTYYAIWEDYIVNDLYSVEFVENKGYKVGNPGKASKYAKDALKDNGTDYVWGDENNELPEVFESQFVEHITEGSNGYIRLKFDASPYAVAQIGKPITNKFGEVITPNHAGTWDSNIVLGGLSGSPYIPAGLIDKVIIRMRYGGVLPTEKTDIATPGSGEGYSTVSPTDFYAPFLYYTNEDYINFTDNQIYVKNIDVSKDIYNGKWFTVVVDAADLKLDSKDLYDFRIDPTNGMLDGSYLDIDFIRFTQKTAGVVNEESVKSQKDFEAEGDARADLLATTIRAQVDNSDRNGVRVMGWLYVYAGTSAHTQNAGWMFSASDRFQKAVADSEDGWMNKLTMDLYNDANFNASSLILVGNYIENGEKKTTAHAYDNENHLFSAVLYNIPVKNYKSNFVVRPYVEYAGKFIYGEPFEMNFYEFAFGSKVVDGTKVYYSGEILDDGTLSDTEDGTANGAYFKCTDHNCAICNYLEECYVNWNAHVAEKATFTEHYNTYFKDMLASPDNLIGNIVVPTGTISDNSAETVKLEVHNSITGKFETITVNKANTWPALVVDGALNSLYTLRPCAISETGTEGVYYIMSLGYGRDSDNGNHAGIEKTDTSVLNGEAAADANEMFIRNRFVPEAQSPFRQINRLAQLPMTGANESNDTFDNSFFLGDHGFGDYWFSTTIWSGTTREYWAGKTAYPLDNAKVVVKYNYKDEEGNITSSEWVTYDKTALYNITTIDFSNISYIVSNDIDNKPVDNETASGSANGISYEGVECPFEVEDLVFLFGEVNVPAASESSMEFDTSFTANYSTDMNNFVYTGDRYNTSNFQRIHENYAAHPGIIQLREYKTSANATASGYIETGTTKMQLDAPLYNNVRIRILYADTDMVARSASGYSATLRYTRSDGVSGSKSFEFDAAGVDADGFMILDFDMSEVFDWRGTITDIRLTLPMLSTGAGYWYIDYIRFLATGYDSSTLPNFDDANVTGIFESFEKGFEINGFESSSGDVFKPTVEFFETTTDAKNGYEEFQKNVADYKAKGEVYEEADGDRNYADWTVDPLYTFDYYGVYNNIITKNTENYGDDKAWNFSTLYDGDFRDLRWSTMVNGGDAFTQYYSNYELKNTTIGDYKAIADEEHTYTIDGTQYTKRSKEIIYKPNYDDGVVSGDVLTMTLNSSALYKGSARKQWSSVLTPEQQAWHFWPHLLIQQSRGSQPVKVTKDEETGKLVTDAKYSAAADRIFAEFDIRLKEFEKIGSNDINMTFLLYAYLCPNVSPGAKIWLGIPLADDSGASSGGMTWGRESGANTHMCNLSQAMVYGSTEGSISAIIVDELNKNKANYVPTATHELGEWIHVKLDLTPYIDMAIEMANAEDAFGLGVTTREDWHFNGVNVGYECYGNVDATFEFANFNFYSYNDPANN